MAKPKTSRQNQILHTKNKIPHGKSNYFTVKANTSRQKKKPMANVDLKAKANTCTVPELGGGKPETRCFLSLVHLSKLIFFVRGRGGTEVGSLIRKQLFLSQNTQSLDQLYCSYSPTKKN